MGGVAVTLPGALPPPTPCPPSGGGDNTPPSCCPTMHAAASLLPLLWWAAAVAGSGVHGDCRPASCAVAAAAAAASPALDKKLCVCMCSAGSNARRDPNLSMPGSTTFDSGLPPLPPLPPLPVHVAGVWRDAVCVGVSCSGCAAGGPAWVDIAPRTHAGAPSRRHNTNATRYTHIATLGAPPVTHTCAACATPCPTQSHPHTGPRRATVCVLVLR